MVVRSSENSLDYEGGDTVHLGLNQRRAGGRRRSDSGQEDLEDVGRQVLDSNLEVSICNLSAKSTSVLGVHNIPWSC
jgi:hypothetical protein